MLRISRLALGLAVLLGLATLAGCGDSSPNAVRSDDASGSNQTSPVTDTIIDTTDSTADNSAGVAVDGATPAPPPPAPVDLEPRPDPAIGATTVLRVSDQQRLTYTDTPAAEPTVAKQGAAPLLLIHDADRSSKEWDAIAPLLRTQRRVIAMDLRGAGNSSAVDCCNTPEERAGDVVTLLDALNISRAAIAGSGAGARVAQWLAATQAQRVAQLLLISPENPADTNSALALIAAPTMVLTGQADTSRNATIQTLADQLQHEVVVTVANAARHPSEEQPEQTATLINKFLSPRGTLHNATIVGERPRQKIDDLSDGYLEGLFLRELTGVPDCSVRFHQIEYQTVGGAGESTNATAGVIVPFGPSPLCNGPRPVVLYAHGSSADVNYNVLTATEVNIVATSVFAARGYIVVAPNYTGYQGSWLNYHPYLNAQAQSDDMIDALRAAQTMLATDPAIAPNKVFVTGYSQGGYVAMATHKRIEQNHADEITVSASFPMSGPYALQDTVGTVLNGRVIEDAPQLFTLFTEGFQRAYGSVFSSPAELFNSPYDQTALGIYPGTMSTQQSLALNLVPARIIAAQGDPHLLRQDFVDDYLNNPDNGLRQALQRNSLPADWVPAAPMQLCGGAKDRVVFFSNTFAARDAFAARGLPMKVWDFNNSNSFPNHSRNTLYRSFRRIFWFGNDDAYHVALAPYCAALARDFFNVYR